MKQVLQRWLDQYFSSEEAVLLLAILVVSLVVFATLGVVLGPVFAALVIAFLLQGVINTLRRRGVSEIAAIVGAYMLFIMLFISVLTVLIPIVGRQTSLLVAELPNMIGRLRDLLVTLPETYAEYISPEQFQIITSRVSGELANLAEQILSLSISSFPGIFGLMIYLLLVPLPLLTCWLAIAHYNG